MQIGPTGEQEAAQRRALERQRRLATGLLLLAAVLFVATRLVEEPSFWVELLRAAAEAALVGGLADWFAVTALFRHPLGLPIPHTAIIPKNKARIGAGLGRFVERNFLHPELVEQKLRSLALAERLSRWLARPENANLVADRIVAALPFMVKSLEDKELRDFLRRTLHDQLSALDLAPILSRVLRLLTEGGHHQALFDRALLVAHRQLVAHEERIYRLVRNHSSWWVPERIDQAIAEKIIAGLQDLLLDLSQRDNDARHAFDQSVQELIQNLGQSEDYQQRVEAFKRKLLSHPEVQGYLLAVWDGFRDLLLDDIAAEESKLRNGARHALQSIGRALERDAPMRERLDRRIESLVLTFIVPSRSEIGRFIAEVVGRWDSRTITDRFELVVGRDLQYIRINGTLVGALVGCLLFLLTQALA